MWPVKSQVQVQADGCPCVKPLDTLGIFIVRIIFSVPTPLSCLVVTLSSMAAVHLPAVPAALGPQKPTLAWFLPGHPVSATPEPGWSPAWLLNFFPMN